MALELESLLGESGSTSLSDLVATERPTDKPIINNSTANNLAAHTAMLANPEEAVSTYRTIRNELALNTGSPTMETLIAQANTRENDLTKSALVDVLSDENLPIEQKLEAASQWRLNGDVTRSPEELVQVKSLEDEGTVVGNAEVDETRWDLASKLRQVNDYNDEVQRLINTSDIDENEDTIQSAVNFLEIVAPFLEGAAVAEVQTAIRDYKGKDGFNKAGGIIRSLGLLGESKEQIKNLISSVPIERRLELAKAVHGMVMSSGGSVVQGKNSMVLMDSLRNYLVEGHYTFGERVIDDAASVLDLFGLGATARTAKAGLKSLTSAADAAKFTRRTPKSLAETLSNTNDRQFNGMLKAAADDETGEVAKTVFNSSREDAIVNAVGPEIGNAEGVVRHKPLVDDAEFNPDMDVVEQISSGKGHIQFSEAEKASRLAEVERELITDIGGVVARKEMSTVRAVDEGVEVRAIYGPVEGGFKNPDQAFEQVKLATRKYGVTDEELTLMRRMPDGTYKPVDAKAPKEIAPPKAGFTRYYYGSADEAYDVRKGDELWVSPDETYARNFRAGPEGNTLWYVDLPNDKLVELGVRDEINNYNIIGKLGKEYAKQAKRLGEALPDGNYVVAMTHTNRYDPSDTIAWGVTDAKGSWFGIPLNIFDWFPSMLRGKAGSITQHLIPSSGYIDPLLFRSATVGVDQAARSKDLLTGVATTYADIYKKLPSYEQKKFDNYIVKANFESLKFNPLELKAAGFSDETIEAIRNWKRTNDTIYVLENTALVRESKRRGFQMFMSHDGDGGYLVKPLVPQKAGDVTHVYDSESKTIRTITKDEKQELYKNGGEIGQARYPIEVDGETIPYVIIRNNENNYARGLRETDQLLNYRDGHFTIYYDAPVFVIQKSKNADKSEYWKAVATAGSIEDAETHITKLRNANPDGEFDFRYDVKGEEFDDLQYNSKSTQGRTAWRTRGKTLTDSSARPTDPEFRHIAAPEESLLRSIGSISHRMNMKDHIDTAKSRFMKQYRDYLPTKDGVPFWPDDVTQLRAPQGQKANLRDFADAKSTFRYIDQIENGFINLLDDGSKAFFKTMADVTGRKGWGWAEKIGRAGAQAQPTAYVRKKVFRLSLAAGPLRQVIVQASQGLPIVLGTNPTFIPRVMPQLTYLRYLDAGGDPESYFGLVGKKLSGLDVEEAKRMATDYQRSGLANITSSHSYMRDQIKQLVARGPIAKTKQLAGKPIDLMQRYGFELGENILLKTIWLSEYDLLKKSGKKIDEAALSMLHARVRNLTGDMNKAMELAYNENMLSPVMQFMQAPHKIFAQIMLGHRGLSKTDRARLGTAYLLTYGTGYTVLYDQIAGLLPDNAPQELRDAVAGGMFNLTMNKVLTELYGDEVNVDFSDSLRLIEVPHIATLWGNLITMNMEEVLKKSPSASLLFSDNGKLGNLIRSIGRVWTTPEDDGRFVDVGRNFLHLFSGASNFLKARYIFKKGVATNTKGKVVDSDVNQLEAFMKIAGFITVDEVMKYALDEKTYIKKGKAREDAKYVVSEISKRLAREGLNTEEIEFSFRLLQESMFAFNDSPALMDIVQQEVRKQLAGGNTVIIDKLLEMSTISTPSEMREMINVSPDIDAETRRKLFDLIEKFKRPEEE